MLLLIMIVVVLVVPAGIALRAKPLGDMPYRWGAFLGVSHALSSPLVLVSAFVAFAGGHLLGGLIFVAEAVLSVWSCIGLLQRRRLGVVLLAALWVLQIMSAPFMERTPSHPYMQTIKVHRPSLSELVAGAKFFPGYRLAFLFTVIPAIVTYVYFRKRWQLMADHTP